MGATGESGQNWQRILPQNTMQSFIRTRLTHQENVILHSALFILPKKNTVKILFFFFLFFAIKKIFFNLWHTR